MYEDIEEWGMQRPRRDRQYSILEYTIQATTQLSQAGYGCVDNFPNILETPVASPDTDHNDHEARGSYLVDESVVHGRPFPSSAVFRQHSAEEDPVPASSRSPSSPPSSEEQEQHRPTPPPRHRQPSSAAESRKTIETLKRDHTRVERNYRSRLNSKIEALSQQLFDVPSHNRAVKPSKCLVISRAAERLEQLERNNVSSQNEIDRLKQEIAVLNHLLAVERRRNT